MSDRLLPCAIAETVPIEQGQITMPEAGLEPEAGAAPRSASSKIRKLAHSVPVAFLSSASDEIPLSNSSSLHPCAEMMSCVGTRDVARTSRSLMAYGAPDAPVMATTHGALTCPA